MREREEFLEIRGELLVLEQFVQSLKIQHEYENGRRREEEEKKKKSTPLAKYWEAWRDDWEEWLDDMADWWDEYHHALWISVTFLMGVLQRLLEQEEKCVLHCDIQSNHTADIFVDCYIFFLYFWLQFIDSSECQSLCVSLYTFCTSCTC